MDELDRISKIQSIVDTNNSVGSKRIMYKNDTKDLKAYAIPVEALIFNQYNGRIGTWVKTYEKLNGTTIDASTEEGENTIIDFLWKSKPERNKKTMEDIESKGQLEVGIVTKDGVVIDGNRRSMLLKKIDKKRGTTPTYFNAVILEDKLIDNPKEIRKLETIYQLGADAPVDYNAIEKYLKCKELFNEDGFTAKEIGKMMGESESKIEEYLSILALMEKFLDHYGYSGIYTYLDEIKAEGPFVDLNNYLNKYRNNPGQIKGRNWTPKPDDIDDLESVYFDYIRAGFGTHKIRSIGNPASGKGIFNNEDIWRQFFLKYQEFIEPVNDNEPSLDDLREKRPNEDAKDLISGRDKDWANKPCENYNTLMGNLKKNKRKSERMLEDVNEEAGPINYLNRALNALKQIDTENVAFRGQDVKKLVFEINSITYEFKKNLK
jgi:hypothetical protein